MANTKKDKQKDEKQQERRSHYDHEEGILTEPRRDDDPKVIRKQVDPVRDPALYGNEGNGPVPRRGDPFAHQRDEKAAEKGAKEEQKKDEERAKKEDDKK